MLSLYLFKQKVSDFHYNILYSFFSRLLDIIDSYENQIHGLRRQIESHRYFFLGGIMTHISMPQFSFALYPHNVVLRKWFLNFHSPYTHMLDIEQM